MKDKCPREGIAILYGFCEISSYGGQDEHLIGKVFGAAKQELPWDEFIAKCPDDTFGIMQKDDLLNKIQELADKVITRWLYYTGGGSERSNLVNIRIKRVNVSDKFINFDFACEYEYQCEQYINWYDTKDIAWTDSLNHLEVYLNNSNNVQEIIDHGDVWFAARITDYEVGMH